MRKPKGVPHPSLKIPLVPRDAFEPLAREGERLLASLRTVFSEGCPMPEERLDRLGTAHLSSAERDERWRDVERAR